MNSKRLIGYFSLPLALTAIVYILCLKAATLPKSWILPLQYSSYAFFAIGMLMALRFNKSKVFFLCLLLGLSQLSLTRDFPVFLFINRLPGIFAALCFFIPINIFLFSILKERGIFTPWGQLKFGLIALQALLLWFLLNAKSKGFYSLIFAKLIKLDTAHILSLSQISVLLFILVFLFLCVRLYRKPSLMDSALLGTVLLTFFGLVMKNRLLGLNLFFAAAGHLLTIGIIEASYFMAYRDELTGIPGRRALKEALLKLGNKYSIAMIDIDFFKKFNDTYGHDTGDKVLQMVASRLGQVAGGGKAFRFGGEEFTILFPNKSKEEVLPVLEELRKDIAKQKLSYKKKRTVEGKERYIEKQLGVTISVGVAEKNEKLKDADEVMQAADKALYKAKKNGRNCVCK